MASKHQMNINKIQTTAGQILLVNTTISGNIKDNTLLKGLIRINPQDTMCIRSTYIESMSNSTCNIQVCQGRCAPQYVTAGNSYKTLPELGLSWDQKLLNAVRYTNSDHATVVLIKTDCNSLLKNPESFFNEILTDSQNKNIILVFVSTDVRIEVVERFRNIHMLRVENKPF